MLSSLLATLDSYGSRVVDLQTQLTAIPALAPENNGDGETLKAHFLQQHLEKDLGLTVTTCHAADDRVSSGLRPNLITSIKGRKEQMLWVIGHMDVVPVGDASLWNTPPFSVTRQGDDILIGRGVEDNQQGIVSALLVVHALKENNHTPELGFGIILVSDEETGMTHGLPHILQSMPDLIHQDDLILVPDMGNSDGSMVQIAEKSVLWLRVTVHGEQCHASTPEKGKNSLVIASECILALDQLHSQYAAQNPLFSPPYSTFVPTKKEMNVENINTVPGKDVFYLDCRILPEYTLDDITLSCQKITDAVALKHGVRISIDPVNVNPSLSATAHDAPVITKLCDSLKADRDIAPVLCGSSGQTVSTILRNKGYQAAAWSTLIANAHQPNERSSIRYTIADARVMMRMICEEA